MSYKFFEIENKEGYSIVWLNNAENANMMNSAFWLELPLIMKELDDNAAIKAVVIAARGKRFSLGLDIESFGKDNPTLANENGAEGRKELKDLILRLQDAISSVANVSMPVICAIQKSCFGGALDLAAACDIRLCTKDAIFSLFEVNVAIVADIGSLQRLPYIIGEGNLKEMAYTGSLIKSSRALQMGLVNQVFDTREILHAKAEAMAKDIASKPAFVVQGIKHVVDFTRDFNMNDKLQYITTYNAAFLQGKDFHQMIKDRVKK